MQQVWKCRNWYSILDENLLKVAMKEEFKNIKVPIVLQHGNNPGLVSHFVKRGLEYIVEKQFKQKRGVLGKRTVFGESGVTT